jgi:hypothetical protein
MVGDALEEYAAGGLQSRLWRQIISIVAAQIREHKLTTLIAFIVGAAAYALAVTSAVKSFSLFRHYIQAGLMRAGLFTGDWVYFCNFAVQILFSNALAFAVGWIVGRSSRNVGISVASIFSLSVLAVEGGSIAYRTVPLVALGWISAGEAATITVLLLGRVGFVMLGGLLGSKTAERSAIA